MAKVPAKTATKKAPAKKTPAKTEIRDIEKTSREALAKLRTLNIEQQLQSDIEWCLGSYLSDGNPVGLYDMVNRSISVLKLELDKKTKGVTAKFIAELESAVSR